MGIRRLKVLVGCSAAVLALSFGGIAFAEPLQDARDAYGRHDYDTAARLFRSLAEEGVADAQLLLGFMYHDGEGVPRDYILSHMWFNLAMSLYPANSQDFHDASEALRLTEKSMTPTEIQAASELAYRCQAQDYHDCQ